MSTIIHTQTIVAETCGSCGVVFGMTKEFRQRKLDRRHTSEAWFHCPNGHRQYYSGKTDAERKQERLERELQRVRNECSTLANLRNAMRYDDVLIAKRAQRFSKARRAAFWKGVERARCGCWDNPYKTNHGGFGSAFTAGQEAVLEVER